ncbi:dolichol kinase [Marasmius tenuissimus]|nr:dolichol kinase [Marasmius tenuissimus]
MPLLTRHKALLTWRHVLPATFELNIRIPFTPYTWTFSLDSRRAGESIILLGVLVYATSTIWERTDFQSSQFSSRTYNLWILTELQCLIGITVLYMLWMHNSLISSSLPATLYDPPPTQGSSIANSTLSGRISGSQRRAQSPRPTEKRNGPPLYKKSYFGFVWMSVPKNYRASTDDGVCAGLLTGPLVSCALLYSSLMRGNLSVEPLPYNWRIEAPLSLNNPKGTFTPLEALVLSRYNAVDLSVMCSSILLFHIYCSWWLERRYSSATNVDGERRSVPRSEARRLSYYVAFALGVSLLVVGLKVSFQLLSWGFWQHLTWLEAAISSLFYQFTLYVAVRLAHRSFTLGELGVVGFGGTALFMELLNITRAKIWPQTTPFIKTFRLPTPLLIFQIALVAGSFLTGFMLSPFLVLSRHIAQRPLRRLRYPEQKLRYRRRLALGFYIGAFIIIVGVIGMWTWWCLSKRDPWSWAIFWLLEGRKKWSRPALLAYWGILGSLSVAGWNRQLARSRRFRARNSASENLIVPGITPSAVEYPPQGTGSGTENPTVAGVVSTATSATLGLTFPNLPSGATVATDWLDAADKHVPTLRLNARRKFFHGLAVVMFVPGVAFDPAFTHLCFSAAFALFTFAEYVRFFAIYPFGASVHLFMNEFLDQKDGGTAILSHFYLLTGCAGSLWLENGSPLVEFTGILVLGVGDSLASVVGKRIGIHRWSPTSAKSLEGSLAFTLSIVLSAWILYLFGMVESFSTLRYVGVIGCSSLLEALSDQNDNLTLPLFTWSLAVLVGIQ